jgi:hypothetical protein
MQDHDQVMHGPKSAGHQLFHCEAIERELAG